MDFCVVFEYGEMGEWMEGATGRKMSVVEAGELSLVPLNYLFETRYGLEIIFKDGRGGTGG